MQNACNLHSRRPGLSSGPFPDFSAYFPTNGEVHAVAEGGRAPLSRGSAPAQRSCMLYSARRPGTRFFSLQHIAEWPMG